jgi:universal stress protein A
MPAIHRLLVPVDFSESSRAAVQYAAYFVEKLGAAMDVLHVWHIPNVIDPALLVNVPGSATLPLVEHARGRSEEDMREFMSSLGPLVQGAHPRVEQGEPVEVILEVARQQTYDMIVMGTHGRRGLTHFFLGSVAERVVRRAPCPVLTIRVPDVKKD